MSRHERGFRKITSIPPRTMHEVWRGQVGASARFGSGGTSLGIGGLGTGVPRQSRSGKEPSFDVHPYVPEKQSKEKPKRTYVFPESERITCEVEEIRDYNSEGDLGIFLQFAGIALTGASFLRSKRNRPDSPVFYIPIVYNKRMVRLFLATRGDIIESQIVPAQMDVNPFFQTELYLPQLTKIYDSTSMTVYRNKNLVIVSYNPRIY